MPGIERMSWTCYREERQTSREGTSTSRHTRMNVSPDFINIHLLAAQAIASSSYLPFLITRPSAGDTTCRWATFKQ